MGQKNGCGLLRVQMDKGAMDIGRRRAADKEARPYDSVGHVGGAGGVEGSVSLIPMPSWDGELRRASSVKARSPPCDLQTELHQCWATDACLIG